MSEDFYGRRDVSRDADVEDDDGDEE